MTLVKTADLDPDKSYLFGFHPHGVISISAFCTFATEALGFSRTFPGAPRPVRSAPRMRCSMPPPARWRHARLAEQLRARAQASRRTC